MPRERGRRAATVIAAQTARRAIRSGSLWGAIFGLYVYASAAGYAATYPSLAARRRLATSLGANAGLATLLGPARRLDTVAGFTAWRTMGVLTLVDSFLPEKQGILVGLAPTEKARRSHDTRAGQKRAATFRTFIRRAFKRPGHRYRLCGGSTDRKTARHPAERQARPRGGGAATGGTPDRQRRHRR